MEKILYSGKSLFVSLLVIFFSINYIMINFNTNGIIIGTIIILLSMSYLAYYSHRHQSSREALALTMITSLTIIIACITGALINFFIIKTSDLGSMMYGFTLTISTVFLNILISKLYEHV